MNHTVLDSVALGYQPVWGRARQLAAVRLTVQVLHPESVDAEHLWRALGNDWPVAAPTLILAPSTPELLDQALQGPPLRNSWLEVPMPGSKHPTPWPSWWWPCAGATSCCAPPIWPRCAARSFRRWTCEACCNSAPTTLCWRGASAIRPSSRSACPVAGPDLRRRGRPPARQHLPRPGRRLGPARLARRRQLACPPRSPAAVLDRRH